MDGDLNPAGGSAVGAAPEPGHGPALTAVGSPRFSTGWLALREPEDAAARAAELLDPLRAHLADPARSDRPARLVIRDLGCGTGSLGRWLSGRLPGPQHWILHDREPELLAEAGAAAFGPAADGRPVSHEVSPGDVTELRAAGLADTSLLATSALLDLLTADEVEQLAEACVSAGCPALLALSVTGQVELTPADALDPEIDAEIAAAFNAHQRRTEHGRRLLGPAAVTAATSAFERRGAQVIVRPSPWRLGTGRAELTAQWLRGWVGAAREQRPELAGRAANYLGRRLAECAAGELSVLVHHRDLLALPRTAPLGGSR